METWPCQTCGLALEQSQRITTEGTYYVCPSGHWWLLSPSLGWLVVPEPPLGPDNRVG